MTEATRAAFVAHVRKLEAQAIGGDFDAARSLACMALLREGLTPTILTGARSSTFRSTEWPPDSHIKQGNQK